MARAEEVFLPFTAPRDRVVPVTSVRGTVLASSLKALRARGLGDAYFGQLAPEFREPIVGMIVSAWLPMSLATAHYQACDALDLDRSTIEDIGGEAGRLINETLLSVVLKLSREVGATPWTALARANRLFGRSWQGGDCAVYKLGPKEARLEWIGQPLAGIRYVRMAFGGFMHGLLTLFATRAIVRELPAHCTATTLGYRCSWV
jgi:hypothetical protein